MRLGELRQQSAGYKAFIPNKFPPGEEWGFTKSLMLKHSEAAMLIGKLDGITQLLPDIDFFLFMYVRKDAASSSQIEGTQATMIDAIEAEAKTADKLPKDVDDILHYVKALNYGMERLKEFPMSLRFIRELHKVLMEGARSSHHADPGEFRKSQNWIGGTTPASARFVPPPPNDMQTALGDFENFLHAKDSVLPLLKIGLIHAQFETIHPFLDGNGRTGRLLISLYLWQQKMLERPVLFLSSYFKRHQQEYYDRLDGYRRGEVEQWINFLLDGVVEISQQAITTAKKITLIREADMEKVQTLGKRASVSAVMVLRRLFALPIVNVNTIGEWTSFSRPGAQHVIDRFVNLGILEQKDKTETYGRSYIYTRYVDAFAEE